ncbi:MAG: hypothetical protein STSR0004_06600 [Peptococcaceae bacterium]
MARQVKTRLFAVGDAKLIEYLFNSFMVAPIDPMTRVTKVLLCGSVLIFSLPIRN